MDKFNKILNVFKGVPSGELLWYFDINFNGSFPPGITDDAALLEDLGCTYPLSCNCFAEKFDNTVTVNRYKQGIRTIEELLTPKGSVRFVDSLNHPVEYRIKNAKDCEVLKYAYEHLLIEPKQNIPTLHYHQAGLGPSPVQQLLQFDMGIETFYYMLADAPTVVEELMCVMQQNQMKRTRIACNCNTPVIYQAENTSTSMISRDFYRRYSLPQLCEQVNFVHSQGKLMVLHMCGLLKGLLPDIRELDIDGIHSVTPEPVGDTPFDLVYNAFDKPLSIQGRFSSTQWLGLPASEIQANLDKILNKDIIMHRPFILLLTGDSADIPYDELKKVQNVLKNYL